MPLRLLLLALCLFAGVVSASAQRSSEDLQLQFTRFSAREGLPHDVVQDIVQDRFGFLWVATRNGLGRFDGYRFRNYVLEREGGSPPFAGLSGDLTMRILEDRSGRLWISTWNGLNRYDRQSDSFRHYARDPHPHPNGFSQYKGFIISLYEDRAGTVWAGTPVGLHRYDSQGDSLRFMQPRPDIEFYEPASREHKGNEILDMLEDRSGRFWIATFDNIYQLDRQTERFVAFAHLADSAFGSAVRQGYSFFETSRGDLWIIAKASNGIDRYDPQTGQATRYRLEGLRPTVGGVPPNAPTLSEDASGRLWLIAAEGDLYRWNEGTDSFQRIQLPEHPNITEPWSAPKRELLQLDNGDVLFGSGYQGLLRIRADLTHEQHLYDPRAVESLNDVRQLLRDRFGSVWIGTRRGLQRLNMDEALFDARPIASRSVGVTRSIGAGGAGDLWLGLAGSALVNLQRGGDADRIFREQRTKVDSLWMSVINDLSVAPNGDVWIAGEGGLSIFDAASGRFRYMTHLDSTYSPEAIEAVRSLRDRGRTVASILHPSDGANNTAPFRLVGPTDVLVVALGESSSPTLGIDDGGWIENEAGERVWSMDPWRLLHSGGDGRNRMQMDVVSLPAGTYRLRYTADYCGDGVLCHASGTWNNAPPLYHEWYGIQLLRLDPDQVAPTGALLAPWAPVGYLPEDQTYAIHVERSGRIWIGTGTHLVRTDDNGRHFTSFALPMREGQTSGDIVGAIHSDVQGRIWVGTARGLLRFDERTGSFTRIDLGLTAHVTRIIADEAGNVWFSTSGNGLGVLRSERQTVDWFTDETVELPNNVIRTMERDDEGKLWLLSPGGLTRFDPITETLITFNETHGVPSFSLGGASTRLPTGELIFGGDDGYVRFRSSALRANPVPPQVAFTSLTFSGRSAGLRLDSTPRLLTGLERIELPYGFSDFTIDYVGLHFAHPERNQYMVKLENYDSDWQRVGDTRSRSFTNLQPGRYVFHVRAANADGIWSDTAESLEIIIYPPWWRTLWAYLGYALLLVGGLYGAATTQRKLITSRERRRSEIESARLRAEAAELESRALKAESERQKNAELLSRIGRDITGTLSIEQIIDTVYENVNALMDATIFGIGIADEELGVIEFPATREKGTRLAPFVNRLDDPNRIAVHCFKNRKEILIGDWDAEINQYLDQAQPPIAGDYSHSVLYLPLIFKDRTVGVITAQSFEKQAYSEYHLDLLRNLATYTAIALDNADAYRRLTDTLDHLKATQQQLVTQEKLASLGALTAGIAHEIKNPLNFVNNFADLIGEIVVELRESLQGDGADAEELLADLEQNAVQIAKHGKRADTIVRNMMAHASGGNLQRSEVDVNELVREYADLAYHGKRALSPDFFARVEVSAAQDLPTATIAAQEIGRVLLNLVGNALDAMEEKARSAGETYTPTVTVSTARVESGIEIRVSDNGPGIPASHRDRVFEPFFTTKSAGKGTGLGLSLSYDIITKGHGGTLRIEDEQDGATTFIIELPLQAVETA